MIKRWIIYFDEMVHPGSRLLLSLFLHLALWAFAHFQFEVSFDWGKLTVGTLTLWMLLVYYRVCDEFKDADTDEAYFPERPVPSGRVKLKDLEILQYCLHALMFLLNAIYFENYIFFLSAWMFDFLMGRWFFVPRLISKNRLMAFITHSPIGWFCAFYLLGLYLPFTDVLSTQSLLYITYLNFPALTWEIARKMRSPDKEQQGYQTYSSLLGLKGSSLILVLSFIVPIVCLYSINILNKDSHFFIWQLIVNLGFLLWMLWKIQQALKLELNLRLSAEIYQGLFLIALLLKFYFYE